MIKEAKELTYAVGALTFVTAIGVGLRYNYHDVLKELFQAIFTEEYSYLFVVLVIFFFILALKSSKAPLSSELSLGKVFAIALLALTSLMFNALAILFPSASLMFKTVSMVIFVWCLATLLYTKAGLRELLLPLLTLILIIPPPQELMAKISLFLSDKVGRIVAYLTGSELIAQGNKIILKVISTSGDRIVFEIATACSGIVSLSSIMAIIPLIIYVAITQGGSLKRRFFAVLLSIVIGSSIAFAGNILRVFLVVMAAKYWGLEAALTLFHSVPSLIYVSIATLLAFYVITKVTKVGRARVRKVKEVVWSTREHRNVMTLIASFAIIASIIMATLSIVPIEAEGGKRLSLVAYSYEYVMNNVTGIVFNDDVKVIRSIDTPWLVKLLGSTVVKRVVLRYNETILSGYVEFAETAVRFHGWWVCLTFQGFKVLRVWNEGLGNSTLTYVFYTDKYGRAFLLAFLIMSVPINFGGKVDLGYVRLSLIKPLGKVESPPAEEIIKLKELFKNIVKPELISGSSRSTERILSMVATLNVVFVILIFTYAALTYGYSLISKLRRRSVIRRGGA